ncbi:long-chain fatty acid--CoA ligase [Pseudomaricurvus alcaniphilus]|uniref:long-chain-fatty-acid--CoA ligase n=1 Tax=Pseudomaricurvus alcaniphilus TaxID=1166482 RepID=UPI00140D7DBF|nr:long-chain-fatty-acid--CoA ligase [Pseudomaricurvus alcaniphilus]NHN36553.1 long-chain fatty acid--CoA ligase [Pseudomaricurvus alcaniphilus]
MQLTQPIHRNAQVQADSVATYNGARSQTWAELKLRISKMASFLNGLGVSEGDRVSILALNSDRYYECFFAIPWAGAVVVPLNTRWSVQENIYSNNDAQVSVLIADDNFIDSALSIAKQVKTIMKVVYIGENSAPEGMIDAELILADAQPMDDVCRRGEDLAGIFYTGGTTGFPKGVMLSHKNLVSNALSNLSSLDLNEANIRYLHAAPMFHMADVCTSLTATLSGSAHIFIPAFSAKSVIAAIDSFKITHVLLVPTMISMLLQEPQLQQTQLSSLKAIVYGASPMTEGILKAVLEQLPNVAFYQAYGQTELSPVVTVLRPEYHCFDGEFSGKTSSAGQCNIGCQIKVVDEQGEQLATGEVGEVAATGPNVMQGYWNNPEQTEKAMLDGWVLTGDAGYLDEDGFLFLVDRKKDMIISGGENVFSAEVENVVSLHAAVQEVVVVGIPSKQWGEEVHAIVRLKPGTNATADEIIAFAKQRIAGYKCPRSVEFQTQAFPITGAGKIRKNEIRAAFWKGSNRQVN